MSGNILKYFSVIRGYRRPFPDVLSSRSIHRSLLNRVEKNDVDDKPVKFTTSAAGKFKAKMALKEDDNRLWYEPIVITLSLSVFLLYFLVLREENDIDEEMFTPLYNRIAGLEQVQLKSVIDHSTNKEEIAEAQKRLEEIKDEK
ncbi:uncharacterized protein LOC123322651 [Coccinella septempunctata]|uniref:uncharacterized protein LOC123322651 n=1 Tax=Coccinella septempunctata TaxID=41139 RepID=UPI001D088678|nr:uncharacterized protein LOC123322651 [Coccinella septempunctata]